MMADYTGPDTSDLKAKYVYVNGDRVARFETDSTDVMYYLKDHLGSTVGIASYAGQLRDVYRYRPFGASWYDAVQTGDMFNYTGQLKDQELNHDLYYYGARYYDPILKIFTQVDPMYGKSASWGPYVYVKNNPMKRIDPDGLTDITITIQRTIETDNSTIGKFEVTNSGDDQTISGTTLELPDRDNKQNVSRIPAGSYNTELDFSPNKGRVVPELTGVPGRTQIQLHNGVRPGNTTGCPLISRKPLPEKADRLTPDPGADQAVTKYIQKIEAKDKKNKETTTTTTVIIDPQKDQSDDE